MSSVKKFSHQTSGYKAPKFFHIIKYTCLLSTTPFNKNSCLRSKNVHDKTNFSPVDTFTKLSKSISPRFPFIQCSQWKCRCLYTLYLKGHFCIHMSHSKRAQPHGMWCRIQFTHFVHNTQTTVCPHNSASVTIPLPQFLHQSLCF